MKRANLKKLPAAESVVTSDLGERTSYFTGSFWSYLGIKALSWMVQIATFSIGNAWMLCVRYRWMAAHTYVDGVRTRFEGTALPIWWKLVAWNLLTLLTLGLYGFKRTLTIEKWRISNTHLDPEATPILIQKPLPLAGRLSA